MDNTRSELSTAIRNPPRVGLVLGSGSARGWAHIGVIEALEEGGIPVDLVTGSSIGAYVGAIYAAGGLASLKEFAYRMDFKKVLSYIDVVFPRSGFIDGKKVVELFSMHSGARTFDDLRIPLRIVATDLGTGQKVVLSSGDVGEAIRASISVPGVMTPVNREGRWLVDGGVVDPVPVGEARAMGAGVVIAVDLNAGRISRRKPERTRETTKSVPPGDEVELPELVTRLMEPYGQVGKKLKTKISQWFNKNNSKPHILDVLGSSLSIMQEQIARINLAMEPADVLIRPRLGDLKLFDFDQAERAVQEGYRRTKEQIEDIQELLLKPESES